MKIFLVLALAILPTLAASACPFCNSETGAQIRNLLFGPEFFFNLSVSLLPFLLSFLITYLIYRGGRKENL